MSVKVDLSELGKALDGLGDTCFLLTTNGAGSPHPSNVRVIFDSGKFRLSAGRRSCSNCAERNAVTLLWPALDDGAMSLLVDGVASVVDAEAGTVELEPTSAIWHRQPD